MIHKSKLNGNFVQISNETANDKRLKLATRGLLASLLSKPCDWRFSIDSLARDEGINRKTVRTMMNELVTFGYATFKAGQGAGEWDIYDCPIPPENGTAKNGTAKNGTAKNGTAYKYINTTKKEKPQKQYSSLLVQTPPCTAATVVLADADKSTAANEITENLFSNEPMPPMPVAEPKRKAKAADPAKRAANVACREAYALAYQARYGIAPVANAKLNSQVSKFVEYVGRDDAPAIAKHYLTDNSYLYVQSGHDFGLLLRDCQKIRQQWYTGKRMTHSEAKQADATQARLSQFDELVAAFDSGELQGWD